MVGEISYDIIRSKKGTFSFAWLQYFKWVACITMRLNQSALNVTYFFGESVVILLLTIY